MFLTKQRTQSEIAICTVIINRIKDILLSCPKTTLLFLLSHFSYILLKDVSNYTFCTVELDSEDKLLCEIILYMKEEIKN